MEEPCRRLEPKYVMPVMPWRKYMHMTESVYCIDTHTHTCHAIQESLNGFVHYYIFSLSFFFLKNKYLHRQAAASMRFKTGLELVIDELRESGTCLQEASQKCQLAVREAQQDELLDLMQIIGM